MWGGGGRQKDMETEPEPERQSDRDRHRHRQTDRQTDKESWEGKIKTKNPSIFGSEMEVTDTMPPCTKRAGHAKQRNV